MCVYETDRERKIERQREREFGIYREREVVHLWLMDEEMRVLICVRMCTFVLRTCACI